MIINDFAGQGINYLTSTKLSPEVSQLPFILLKKKLNELLYETAKMSSVTRRGAGLSIMVHRIVSNDRKKGKVSLTKSIFILIKCTFLNNLISFSPCFIILWSNY